MPSIPGFFTEFNFWRRLCSISSLQQFNFLERTGAHTQGISDMFSSDVCKNFLLCRGDFQGSSFQKDSWRLSKLETLSWLAGLLLVIVTRYASKGRFCPSRMEKIPKSWCLHRHLTQLFPLSSTLHLRWCLFKLCAGKLCLYCFLGVELSSLLQHQVLNCVYTTIHK